MNSFDMKGHTQPSTHSTKQSLSIHFEKSLMENYENATESMVRSFNCKKYKNEYPLSTINVETNAAKSVMTVLKDTNSLDQSETIKCRQKTINDITNSESTTLSQEDISNLLLSCRSCEKTYKTAKDFKDHECVDGEKDINAKHLKCKYCSLTFTQKSHLQHHIIGHKRNNCTFCKAQFAKRKALCQHLKTEHNINEPLKIYNCTFCDKKFSKKPYLIDHLKVHADGQHVCGKCGFMCKSESEYADHTSEHVKQSKYTCDLCGKTFVRRQQHDQHMLGHNTYACSQCNVSFSTKKLFRKHQRSVHCIRIEVPKAHSCSICNKGFYRRQLLLWHMRVHTGEKPLKCSHCEKSFRNKSSLRKHMKSARHLQRVGVHEGKPVQVEKPYQCVQCGTRFHRQQSLFRHIELLHSESEAFKCSHCDYSTKSKTNLKRHEQSHSDNKPFVCEICGLSFRALSNLKEHNVFVHTEDRCFVCQICLKSFKSKSVLQRHFKTHCEIRPYTCHCGRAFKRLSHLKRHTASVHSEKETPVVSEAKEVSSIEENNNVPSVNRNDELSCIPQGTVTFVIVPYNNNSSVIESQYSGVPSSTSTQSLLTNSVPTTEISSPKDTLVSLTPLSPSEISAAFPGDAVSLDDSNLNLSPSSFCNFNLISNTDILANAQTLHDNDILSFPSPASTQSSANPSYCNDPICTDAFSQLPHSSEPAGSQIWPFLMSDGVASPPHTGGLSMEQNASTKNIFEDSDDSLSLSPYTYSMTQSCSSDHLFNNVRDVNFWESTEHSKPTRNELRPNDNFSTNLPSSSSNMLHHNVLFPNESLMDCALDTNALASDLDSLSNLC